MLPISPVVLCPMGRCCKGHGQVLKYQVLIPKPLLLFAHIRTLAKLELGLIQIRVILVKIWA